MSLAVIQSRLTDVLGVDPTALGGSVLDSAVRRRMRETRAATLDAYARSVGREGAEFDELASAVLVHETSFFRYPASFGLLARYARERLGGAAESTAPFRVHCVACATGEEPATAVMALLEAGVEPDRLHVDATDVGPSALAHAVEGRYRKKSLRSVPPGLRERYFEPDGDAWRLVSAVRERIHFRRANVLDTGFSAEAARYDAVFCRNLLIYLVSEARQRALATVLAMLRANGLLFVGHAEVAAVRERGLSAARPAEAFACRNATAARRSVVAEAWTPADASQPETVPAAMPSPAGAGDALAAVRALADAGRLVEARRLLDVRLARSTPTADDYHLLGVIESADARSDASEEALIKALYLDPAHYPALLQLALLMEERGDAGRAARMREKAGRVHAKWRARNGAAGEEDVHGEA